MTNTYKNVYEANGPLKKYFDKIYQKDLYFGEKSWEKAEVKLLKDSISLVLEKAHLKDDDIDLIISGDLQNQLATSDYAIRDFSIPFLGIYNACATSSEGLIIGAMVLEAKKGKRCIVSVASHNMAAEKQYRNPTEYGAPKPDTATFTVTGGASILLTNKKSDIRVESSTVGRIVDKGIKDVNHMGAVMAPAAADTIYRHLTDLKRDVSYYDMILTGDLGECGKKILVNYMKEVYHMDISSCYNDCGTMIYDTSVQPVFSGGSGPVCSALVNYGYVYQMMKRGKVKRVLIVPTGAIFSPTMVFQKESIPAIAHAVSLEVVEA